MPRKKTHRKKVDGIHTHIVLSVDHFEAGIEIEVNSDVYNPEYAWFTSEKDPLYKTTNQVKIGGTCTYPDERSRDSYHLIFYGDDSPSCRLNAILQDVLVRDKYEAPKFRSYRGRNIPVYDAPEGLALLDKTRGEAQWSAWIRVVPRMVTDMLLIFAQNKQLFLTIHEWRFERKRWIRSVGLQTNDPEKE